MVGHSYPLQNVSELGSSSSIGRLHASSSEPEGGRTKPMEPVVSISLRAFALALLTRWLVAPRVAAA